MDQKKRIIYTALALIFWVPPLLLKEHFTMFGELQNIIPLIMKGIGIIFIVMVVKNSRCHECGKIQSGWNVKSCSKCGESFENT